MIDVEPKPIPPTESWAINKLVNPGGVAWCHPCNSSIKFMASERNRYVIVNVYEDKKWVRTETWHPQCYTEAGWPFGEPIWHVKPPKKPKEQRGS